jgi:DNA-binding PadR family transcriptional regulator
VTDKDLYGGMIRLHILHHAAKEPVFGLGIIEELRHHGYQLSPGTLYPMLHGMEKKVSHFTTCSGRSTKSASI